MNPPEDINAAAAIPWRVRTVEKRVDQHDIDLDLKADKTDLARIEAKVNWLIASLFVLTITIASSVISLIIALGGGT